MPSLSCQVCRLITYSPATRKLLSDRRLLPFLRERPEFEVLTNVKAPDVARVRMKEGVTLSSAPPKVDNHSSEVYAHSCDGCGQRFVSRSAMFKHLKGENVTTGAVPTCTAVLATIARLNQSTGALEGKGALPLSGVLRDLEHQVLILPGT